MRSKIGLGLLTGIGLGTGLMYFLDPNRGKQRRAALRHQVKSTSRNIQKAARTLDGAVHDLAKTANAASERVFMWKKKALRLVA